MKKRFWAGLLLAQFLLFYALSKSDKAIWFFEWLFEMQKNSHAFLPSRIPFSVGDILYTVLFVSILYKIVQLFIKEKRGRALMHVLIAANIFFLLYQMFWGMLYFQKPIKEKLNHITITTEILKELAREELEICKNLRTKQSQDKNGVFKMSDISIVEMEVLKGQSKIPKRISSKNALIYNNIKPSLFSPIASYTGILGYYNPFTAEAQYNDQLPESYIPFTIAHESAHQLGLAREQEANFIGYLIGTKSSDPSLQYATHYFALKSILNALYTSDEVFVESMLSSYSDGMKRDRLYEIEFRKKHEGIVDRFFGWTNDLFLKTNQQEGSITYSYFVDLLIQYKHDTK